MAYFPAAIFLEKIPPEDLPLELAVEAAWLVFFIVVCRLAYGRGVKRYSGFGG
ncbi:ABC-2 family transporter protein [Rubripirellula sp.]|nr:ABC-2 family transporter protein [Rubripirellula sp.]